MSHSKTVYISIGNSDDKLSQLQWSGYYQAVWGVINTNALKIYGQWVSESTRPYQNACWAAEFEEEDIDELKTVLTEYRKFYNQDSIAWAVAETEFI